MTSQRQSVGVHRAHSTAVAHCRIVKAEAMMFVTNTVGKNVIIICKTTKKFSLKGLGHVKKNGMKRQNTTMVSNGTEK